MRHHLYWIVTLFVFLTGCASEQKKPGVFQKVLSEKVLRVGVTGDYKPFSFRDPKTQELSGIDIDLAKHLAQTLKVHLIFVSTSWPTLMADLKARRFDIALSGISKTADREKQALFSIGYHRGGKQGIGRCQQRNQFASLKAIDQASTRVIVNPGGTNEAFTRTVIKKAQIVLSPDNRAIFQEIVDGRADVMFTDGIEVELQSNIHKGKLCSLQLPPFASTLHQKAALLPQDSKWKQVVDTWLLKLKESGELATIFAKHL